MRKHYILLIYLIIGIGSLVTLYFNQEMFFFQAYPAVDVQAYQDNHSAPDAREIYAMINQIAQENDLLIAQRLMRSNGDQVHFVYQPLGIGTLPRHLALANDEEIDQSTVVNSYLVVDGADRITVLQQAFDSLGYRSTIVPGQNGVTQCLAVISPNWMMMVVDLLILMGLVILSLIKEIESMRNHAIKRLAGLNKIAILLPSWWADIQFIFSGCLITMLIGSGVISHWSSNAVPVIYLFIRSMLFITTVILFVIGMMAVLFSTRLSPVRVQKILKRQLPVMGLIVITLVGEVLVMVSLIILMFLGQKEWYKYQEYTQASQMWQAHASLYSSELAMGFGMEGISETDNVSRNYQLATELVENADALIVQSPLNRYLDFDEIQPSQDEPFENYLIVTPNYLDYANIDIPKPVKERLNHLEAGQIGLLIPESLQTQQPEAIDYMKQLLTDLGREGLDNRSPMKESIQLITESLRSNQSYFLFNTTGVKQFTIDPLIIVMSPNAARNSYPYQYHYLTVLSDELHLTQPDKLQEQLNKHQLSGEVRSIRNDASIFQQKLATVKREAILFLVGAILGTFVTTILFMTLLRLYFDHFRRDHLIMRLAGLNIWQIHANYITMQLSLFLLVGYAMIRMINHPIIVVGSLGMLFICHGVTFVYQWCQHQINLVQTLKGG